jgi:hypothetical protein
MLPHILANILVIACSLALVGQSADILEWMGLTAKANLERELMIPMRDGVGHSTAVIRPTNVTGRFPIILIRTPYDKDGELADPVITSLVNHGYAIVIQNERGREWSEGKYQFLAGARNDGYDRINLIVQQPWSNGKVGPSDAPPVRSTN